MGSVQGFPAAAFRLASGLFRPSTMVATVTCLIGVALVEPAAAQILPAPSTPVVTLAPRYDNFGGQDGFAATITWTFDLERYPNTTFLVQGTRGGREIGRAH